MSHKTFSQDLQEVKDEILLLSSMVEEAIMSSAEALKNHDLRQARQAMAGDTVINQKRFETEISIMVLIAIQQPSGHDLRLLAASLNLCTELERMADYAKGIAKINLRSEGLSLPRILRDIYSMAEKVVDMLHRSMTAFANEDLQAAKAIIQEDDIIDQCNSKLYEDAIHSVLVDPVNIEQANYVIWTAHHLERLGDRVTSICEKVAYIVTSEQLELDAVPQESELPLRGPKGA